MTMQPKSFDPATADPRAFREALGRFGTGVTVITCASAEGPVGITANSFASLSLDPPLVLWSPAKSSGRYPFFMAAQQFAIHVLGAEQADVASGFAKRRDAFDALDWTSGENGAPVIAGCLSVLECNTVATHDGGDHTIVVGRVTRVTTQAGAPLMFFGGAFGGFTPNG